MSEPAFGVVLVNWNGAPDTIAALESLHAAADGAQHVVVVDNGSAPESVGALRTWADAHAPGWNELPLGERTTAPARWLTLITAGRNLGFSGANNVGLTYLAATHDTHFLLLNNDAMVAPDYFVELRAMLAREPDAALVGSLILRHPERDRVWFAGGYEVPRRALVLHRLTLADAQHPHATEFVTGCAMLISRELYDAQGGLADVYNPIYWEDTDYSFRARSAGWKVMMAPRARVYHRVGASGGGEALTPRTAFLQNRNRGFYVRRNYRGRDRLVALAYLVATKPARALVEALRGRPKLGMATFRGFARGVFGPLG